MCPCDICMFVDVYMPMFMVILMYIYQDTSIS